MVKTQSRSTSASLEAGFTSFSKMIVIFEPVFVYFVDHSSPPHPQLGGRAGESQGSQDPNQPPQHHRLLWLLKQGCSLLQEA